KTDQRRHGLLSLRAERPHYSGTHDRDEGAPAHSISSESMVPPARDWRCAIERQSRESFRSAAPKRPAAQKRPLPIVTRKSRRLMFPPSSPAATGTQTALPRVVYHAPNKRVRETSHLQKKEPRMRAGQSWSSAAEEVRHKPRQRRD